MMERNTEEGGMHVEQIDSGDIAFVIAEDGVLHENEDINLLEKVPKVPEDWFALMKKEGENAEPDFEAVDNHGNWNSFIFRLVYEKIGKGKEAKYKYVKHEIPTGCTPVPLNKDEKRIINGWEFI